MRERRARGKKCKRNYNLRAARKRKKRTTRSMKTWKS